MTASNIYDNQYFYNNYRLMFKSKSNILATYIIGWSQERIASDTLTHHAVLPLHATRLIHPLVLHHVGLRPRDQSVVGLLHHSVRVRHQAVWQKHMPSQQ